jgi:hypothetical protein
MTKNGASYVVGNEYAVLSISKKEAERHGIGDAKQVTIEMQPNGILIKKLAV